ncbi:unnamed protein product [Caenorhabditis angaria]|uniref:Uncharacterized protein n=1 Tax=Caenorhabditis angaria TaxID=860376 RepID=A0A9P1I7Q2_9PELO|nr:unnamed protein product [Caenorhabditis angaria]
MKIDSKHQFSTKIKIPKVLFSLNNHKKGPTAAQLSQLRIWTRCYSHQHSMVLIYQNNIFNNFKNTGSTTTMVIISTT